MTNWQKARNSTAEVVKGLNNKLREAEFITQGVVEIIADELVIAIEKILDYEDEIDSLKLRIEELEHSIENLPEE